MVSMSSALLGLMTQTPLHAGSGSANDVIDLPVQREAHSDWPCVYGSGVKGALRARAEQLKLDQALINRAFGPDTKSALEHAGALLVSDARLLLLPVRSLNSHFKRVTCPALLRRLARDAQRLGLPAAPEVPSLDEQGSNAIVAQATRDADLYLEEFRFSVTHQDLSAWVDYLSNIAGSSYKEEIAAQLTIVSDDNFRHLCRSALPVQAHVRLESDTKTVAPGALWYEESLAPDTLLYVALHTRPSRDPNGAEPAPELQQRLLAGLFEAAYLQLGGNETPGMGWCQVNVVTSEAQA